MYFEQQKFLSLLYTLLMGLDHALHKVQILGPNTNFIQLKREGINFFNLFNSNLSKGIIEDKRIAKVRF